MKKARRGPALMGEPILGSDREPSGEGHSVRKLIREIRAAEMANEALLQNEPALRYAIHSTPSITEDIFNIFAYGKRDGQQRLDEFFLNFPCDGPLLNTPWLGLAWSWVTSPPFGGNPFWKIDRDRDYKRELGQHLAALSGSKYIEPKISKGERDLKIAHDIAVEMLRRTEGKWEAAVVAVTASRRKSRPTVTRAWTKHKRDVEDHFKEYLRRISCTPCDVIEIIGETGLLGLLHATVLL
jgi:hypothetical protein